MMTLGIDDKAEAPDFIFGLWHQKAALLDARIPFAAERGDAFDRARMMAGCDGRRHDPVAGMALVETPTVLLDGFTRAKGNIKDRLPFIRPDVLDRSFRMTPFLRCEQLRESDGDDRPAAVLLVPSSLRS